MSRERKGQNALDGILISLITSLLLIGFFVKISAAGISSMSEVHLLDFSTIIGQQFLFTIISILLFGMILLIDPNFWSSTAFVMYGGSIFLLCLVLLLGVEIKGAKSWFDLGIFSFQPAELAKLGTSLAMANYLSNSKVYLKNYRDTAKALLIVGLPVALIFLQPDMGSAIVFASFLFVMYREGMSDWILMVLGFFSFVFIISLLFGTKVSIVIFMTILAIIMILTEIQNGYFLIGFVLLTIINFILINNGLVWWSLAIISLIVGVMMIYYFNRGKLREISISGIALTIAGSLAFLTEFVFNNFLAPHQQDRINVWLHPERCDPRGSLYNVILSKLAISNGSLMGKGFLKGELTKFNYVPEHTTDFIFCIIGEEQGFIGVFVFLAIFFALIARIVVLAEKQKLTFSRVYFYAIAGILFMHVFVNIGMTLGLVPVIGIPLPFISYGGSSLMVFSIMLAILARMDYRKSML